MNQEQGTTVQLLARLLVGAVRSESRDFDRGVAKMVGTLRGALGDDAKKLVEATEPVRMAVLYSCVDYAILDGGMSEDTKKAFEALSPEEKALASLSLLVLTGRAPHKPDSDRWVPPLWKLKSCSERFMQLSPVKIEPEAVATVVREIVWSASKEMVGLIAKNLA